MTEVISQHVSTVATDPLPSILDPGPPNLSPDVPEVKETQIKGITLHALVVNGEEYVCLPEVRTKVLYKSPAQVYNKFRQLGLDQSTFPCTAAQFHTLKRCGAVDAQAKTCRLVAKQDAERLCLSFRNFDGVTMTTSGGQYYDPDDDHHGNGPQRDQDYCDGPLTTKRLRDTVETGGGPITPLDHMEGGVGQENCPSPKAPRSASTGDDMADMLTSYKSDSLSRMSHQFLAPLNMHKNTLPAPTSDKHITVKHLWGTNIQYGTLIPRYQIRSDSKCILCKDCGIFFSPNAFLKHAHDEFGRKVSCNSDCLQLGIDEPSDEECRLWHEFQERSQGKNGTPRKKVGFDNTNVPATGIVPPGKMRMDQFSDAELDRIELSGFQALTKKLSLSDNDRKSITPNGSDRENTPPLNIADRQSPSEILPTAYFTSAKHTLAKYLARQETTKSVASMPVAMINTHPHMAITDSGRYYAERFMEYASTLQPPGITAHNGYNLHNNNEGMDVDSCSPLPAISTTPIITNGTWIEPCDEDDDDDDDEDDDVIDDVRGDDNQSNLSTMNGDKENDERVQLAKEFRNPDKQDDPLFVLKTAQELLALAATKVQKKEEQDRDLINYWRQLYEQEKKSKLEAMERIKILEKRLDDQKRDFFSNGVRIKKENTSRVVEQ